MSAIANMFFPWLEPWLSLGEYWLNFWRRQGLFWNTLIECGDKYHEHIRKEQPPVLAFDYEIIIDGRINRSITHYSACLFRAMYGA